MDELRESDPDWEHVPKQLRELDGEPVKVTGIDRETGERVTLDGALHFWPGDFGDVARQRDNDGA